ncbi:hypothetical protein [Brevibacillus sp. NRS-1366]|uniref:hypothetical protein n=1 Tax=Brevibacillus sp. NRS-1366 TaxID=3233899 RepID=UPI003D231DA4
MFVIEYDFNIKEEELSQLSLDEFEGEYGGILYGQLLIQVNEQRFGSCDPDAPDPIRDFFEAPIIAWLGLLCEVVIMKQDHPYVALNSMDEVFLWFEFLDIDDDVLHVALLLVDREYTSNRYLVTEQINQISQCLWKEEIKKQELIDEILLKTEKLVNYLETVNPVIINSRSMQGLLKKYDIVKSVI